MADAALASPLTSAFKPPGGTLDDAMAGSKSAVDKLLETTEKSREELKTRTEPLLADISKGREEARGLVPPKLAEIPPAPQATSRNPIEAFGSLASTLAIFGSMMTRQPLTNALNAAAGVMNAWKAQDRETAQKEFDVWKANIDNAKTLFSWQQTNYANELKRIDTDVDGALKNIQALAAVYKDDVTAQLAATKQVDQLFKNQAAMDKLMGDLTTKQDDLIRLQNFQMAVSEKEAELKRPLNAQERGELTAKYLSTGAGAATTISKDSARLAAQGLLAGDPTLVQGLGRSGANKGAVMDALGTLMEEQGIPENERGVYIANARAAFEGFKTVSRETARLASKFAMFKGNAEAIADEVLRTSDKYERFGSMTLNNALTAIGKEFGDEAVAEFEVALNTFSFEYGRALQQVGVTTDSSREHIREMFSRNMTMDQIRAAINQAKREMGLIGTNIGNVKGLLFNMWKATTPNVAPAFRPGSPADAGKWPEGQDPNAPAAPAKPAPAQPQKSGAAVPGVEPAKIVPTKAGNKAQIGFESPEYLAPPPKASGEAAMEPAPQATTPLGGVARPGTAPQVFPLPPTPNPAVLVNGRAYKLPNGEVRYYDAATGKFYLKPRGAP